MIVIRIGTATNAPTGPDIHVQNPMDRKAALPDPDTR